MASSCAVIAADSGGLKETVRNDKRCGLLCDDTLENPFREALAQAMADTQRTRQMGREGRSRAVAEFSFKTMAQNLNKFVMDLATTTTTAAAAPNQRKS
jgi:glycosyltransferase involved in cell wall biosynthesis